MSYTSGFMFPNEKTGRRVPVEILLIQNTLRSAFLDKLQERKIESSHSGFRCLCMCLREINLKFTLSLSRNTWIFWQTTSLTVLNRFLLILDAAWLKTITEQIREVQTPRYKRFIKNTILQWYENSILVLFP